MNEFRHTAFFALVLSTAFTITSCDKEESPIIIDSEILGKWQSTTFLVTGCTRVSDNVEMRACDFSETDDVDCGILEFRSDGILVEDNRPLEQATRFALDQNRVTFIDQSKDSLTF